MNNRACTTIVTIRKVIASRFPGLTSLLLVLSVLSLSFSFPVQGVTIHKRVMTDQEFQQLKDEIGVAMPGVNYNVIIDGHGTGLKPPTETEWEQIRNLPILVDSIDPLPSDLPYMVDNSATPWFPPIGDQFGEGSCVAFTGAYYMKTFMEAKEHDWDLSDCVWEGGMYGHPSPDCQNHIFSPEFVYHLGNGGVDQGMSSGAAGRIMAGIGAATWDKMPYDTFDWKTWPPEDAWRQAPLYRLRGGSAWTIDLSTDEGIQYLKVMLASENLAAIFVNWSAYEVLSEEDLWTSDSYTSILAETVNHANTVVGYDDNFGPYIEDGVEKYGAFKVANSNGIGGWENVPDGFLWISTETMKLRIQYAYGAEDILDYQPKMIAVFEIDHARRGEVEIKFELDNVAVKRLNDFTVPGDTRILPFPENKMIMDVTELMPLDLYGQFSGVLGVFDGKFNTTGTVKHFSVEIYDDYLSGIPAFTVISPNAPLATENLNTVYLTVSSPWAP